MRKLCTIFAVVRLTSILVIACLSVTCRNIQQEHPDLFDSNKDGLELVLKSAATHGDFFSNSISFAVNNPAFIHPGQSLRATPPFESYLWNRTYRYDASGKIEISTSKQVSGGYVFNEIWVTGDNSGHYYNLNTKTYYADNTSMLALLDLVPQTYLRSVLKNRGSITQTGISEVNGQSCFIVEGMHGSFRQRMWIDQQSHLVIKIETIRNTSPYGDGLRSYYFTDYKTINGISLPGRVQYISHNSVFGDVENTYLINEIDSSTDSAAIIDALSECAKIDYSYRKNAEAIKLSDRLYVLENISNSEENWSYNVLFAEFDAYVLVTEAPLDNVTSERVIQKIKEIIPNKPIRYLVQSHHHNDHIGGIRTYIAEGTTIVTTKGNTEFIDKIARAPYNLLPDRLSKNSNDLKFELADPKLVIGDDIMAAEVYNIGPTLHANEMLVTYFPKQGVLFQADLINDDEWPLDSDLTKNTLQAIKKLGLKINTIVGLHGRTIHGKDAQKLFDAKL